MDYSSKPQLDFLCVGPQRTATSWLDRALRQHPQLALPAVVKETFFLDRLFERGWEWYWKEFFPPTAEPAGCRGEIAPTVFDHPQAPARLLRHNPKARIIVCVRDPVKRSLSLYQHYHATSRVGDDFSAALRRRPEILDASRYRLHIERWVAAFGAERVLLVPHSAVDADPLGTVNAIYAFLQLPPVEALPEEVRDRYGAAVVPRVRWLAMLANRTARLLRALGLHSIANAGKALGLKALLMDGGRGGPPQVAAEHQDELRRTLQQESAFSEALSIQGVVTAAQVAPLLAAGQHRSTHG